MNIQTIRTTDHWQEILPRSYCRTSSSIGFGQPTTPVNLPRKQILLGDAQTRLRELPSRSIDCAVTSPPYFALRDYGVKNQLGLESDVDGWVANLRSVFHEVGRVLKPGGSLWLNLGDSFSRHPKYGAVPKSLLAAPERLLLSLMDDGWIVRGKVIWHKPNGMPNSVVDRPNLNYEVFYFLVRSPHYFADLDAIREPHKSRAASRAASGPSHIPAYAGPLASGSQDGLRRAREAGTPGHRLGKNPGSVWSVPTRGFRGPHFATFPPTLIRRPILFSCPEAICSGCGIPWKRRYLPAPGDTKGTSAVAGELIRCDCQAPSLPGVVLDPFMGSGTTAVVANQLGRHWIGIELSPQFRDLALKRIEAASRGG